MADANGVSAHRNPVRWSGWRRAAKRWLDLSVSAAGLVVLSPVLMFLAIVSLTVLGRPVLFRQVRPGLTGRPFSIVKFRTMRAPREGEVWFRSDAVRLTRWGRFLRASSLDELPELWNVLIGEMSLVGPRPLLMEYLEKYTERESTRHEMPPGITGWAQVNGRQNLPFSKRLELDCWYIDNWSLMLDMRILGRTVVSLFRREGVLPGQDVSDVDDLGLSADQRGKREKDRKR